MTRTTNARLAGFMFLFYIATGITSMVLFRQATSGAQGTATTLASLAQHATTVRLTAVLRRCTRSRATRTPTSRCWPCAVGPPRA
jgi:hypothetical protein